MRGRWWRRRRGLLLEEWRVFHDPYWESGLCQQILEERKKRWRREQIELFAWYTCTPPEEVEALLSGTPEGSEEDSEGEEDSVEAEEEELTQTA